MALESLRRFLPRNRLTRPFYDLWVRYYLKSHGRRGIRRMGHRDYVGGMWEEIGRLQFDFLVKEGLRPEHYLLDIACGSLRAGVHFIPYLEPGHYLGIDKEPDLIRQGIEEELGREAHERYQPQLRVSADFDFAQFDARPDFAIAQSLFTHLPPPLIDTCFARLRSSLADRGVFYATFFETNQPIANAPTPHDHGTFAYTREEMLSFGSRNGWSGEYIGDWNHPRDQMMVRYRPA